MERGGSHSPQIANRPLKIEAVVKSDHPNGVVLAQGGRQHGYALHFIEGKPAFDVRIDGKVTRLAAAEPVHGEVKLSATLEKKTMTLTINDGKSLTRSSPGLIPVQPIDELSIGSDDRTAAGDYSPPNRFQGTILRTKVTPGK